MASLRGWLAARLDVRAAIAALSVAVLAANWLWIGMFLESERTRAIRDAGMRTAGIANAIAEHASSTLAHADDALLLLSAEYLHHGAHMDTAVLQRTGALSSPLISRISVIGADGYRVAGSNFSPNTYMGEYDNFRFHVARDTGQMHIGVPVIGAASGKWTMHATRRITARDGSFAGVAVVGLNTQYFSKFYDSIDIGQGGFLSIVGRDGIVRAADLVHEGMPRLGQDLGAQELAAVRRTANGALSTEFVTQNDGTRVVSSRAVSHYPLVAMVAMNGQEVLRGYESLRTRYVGAAIATSALIVLLSLLLIRAFSRQMAVARTLREREDRLAHAVEEVRGLSAHHSAVREEERARIARKLHDDLGQLLTGMKLSLSALVLGGADIAGVGGKLAPLLRVVEAAMVATRDAVSDLRPPALDNGLVAAIVWLAGEFERRTGIFCGLDLPGAEPQLDDISATALFRVAQESLTNVARHSAASSVTIGLSVGPGRIRLLVADDGCGFSVGAENKKQCFGLRGMRERVVMLGGELVIQSCAESGTRVEVFIDQARGAA